MLTIQPVNHIYTKNNIHNIHSNNSKPQQIFSDNISFKGIIIRQAKNETEVKELVNLFYNAIKHNIEPDKKTFKLFEKVERYLCTLPFLTVAKKPSSITEIVKSDNKLAGGYSININIPDSTAHIGFITLTPEYMKTKAGIKILKTIGEQICSNLELNNIKELTWTTNLKNKQINKMLKRFGAEKVRQILSETEYKISLEQFKSELGNIKDLS